MRSSISREYVSNDGAFRSPERGVLLRRIKVRQPLTECLVRVGMALPQMQARGKKKVDRRTRSLYDRSPTATPSLVLGPVSRTPCRGNLLDLQSKRPFRPLHISPSNREQAATRRHKNKPVIIIIAAGVYMLPQRE